MNNTNLYHFSLLFFELFKQFYLLTLERGIENNVILKVHIYGPKIVETYLFCKDLICKVFQFTFIFADKIFIKRKLTFNAIAEIPADIIAQVPAQLTSRRLRQAQLAALPENVLLWLAEDISAGFWLAVEAA